MADAVVDAVRSFLEFTTLLDVVAENASLACSVASAAANAMQMDLPEMLIIAMKYPYTDYLSRICLLT